jgi:hypothetical protein
MTDSFQICAVDTERGAIAPCSSRCAVVVRPLPEPLDKAIGVPYKIKFASLHVWPLGIEPFQHFRRSALTRWDGAVDISHPSVSGFRAVTMNSTRLTYYSPNGRDWAELSST